MKKGYPRPNILTKALQFKKNKADTYLQIGNAGNDAYIIQQIKRTIDSEDKSKIEPVAIYLGAMFGWSSRKCKLLNILLGEEAMAKLEEAGFINATKKLDRIRNEAYEGVREIQKKTTADTISLKKKLAQIVTLALELQ